MRDSHPVRRIAMWCLAVLLAASFLMSAWPKLSPGETMVARFQAWGYPGWFATVVGVMESLGAVLVLAPAAAAYGAALLALVMVGATGTHLISGIGSPTFALIYLVLAAVLCYLRWSDAWHRRAGTAKPE